MPANLGDIAMQLGGQRVERVVTRFRTKERFEGYVNPLAV